MDTEWSKKLEDCGIDIVKTRERFMDNDDLYIKFLKKFLDDDNYQKMKASILERDYEKAYKYAHTLKGLSANLGMNNIQHPVSDIMDKMRNNHYDNLDKEIEDLDGNYINICNIIKSL